MKYIFLSLITLAFAGCHTAGQGWTAYPAKTLKHCYSLSKKCFRSPASNPCAPQQCNTCGSSNFGPGSCKCCLIKDSWTTKHDAKKLSAKHMPQQSCPDFRRGFEQAFIDVAMGASGEVPPLAPRDYWDSDNRTAAGHARAQAWFEGYAAGANIARGYCDRFLDVASNNAQCGYEQSNPLPVQMGY